MRKHFLPIFALGALTIAGCRKDEDNPPSNNPAPAKYYAQSIEWSYGARATIHYNADSTLDSIRYVSPLPGSVVDFSWTNNQMTGMAPSSSLYMTTFAYNTGLMTSLTNAYKVITSPSGYIFRFTYGAGNRLSEVKYFQVNEAGSHPTGNSTYTWSSTGELKSVTTTGVNGNILKYTIDAWSDTMDIQTWLFVGSSRNEYEAIYNYPVLSILKRLPAKITRTSQNIGEQPVVDRVLEHVYDITNKRLDKIVTTLVAPSNPGINQSYTTIFRY